MIVYLFLKYAHQGVYGRRSCNWELEIGNLARYAVCHAQKKNY